MRRAIIALCLLAAIACEASPRRLLMARHRSAAVDEDFDGVAWYKMTVNEDPQTDSSGNGYDADLEGDAAWSSADGGIMGFSGAGDLAFTAPVTAFPFTMAAWVNLDVLGANQEVVSISDESANTAWELLVKTDNRVVARQRGSAVLRDATSSGTLSTGTWYHVAAVFVSDADRSVYLNGTAVQNTVSAPALSGIDIGRIGTLRILSTDYNRIDGYIDDVRIYDTALDSTAINDIYDEGPPSD